ncbi:MAG: amylo-alpha-1,6-glucosidase [Actinomycetota bacterium]|nr:amylo-alpha-1,6-glucosidase [Actinomycetota bacterium]
MGDPWTFNGVSAPLGSNVTLVQGSAFCISGVSGDVSPGSSHGLFFRDSRFLSRFELMVNGQQPEGLASNTTDPFSAVFVGRTRPRPGHSDSALMLFRYRYIGRGMREDLVIKNFADEPSYCSVQLTVEADFADLFDVKEGLPAGPGDRSVEQVGAALVFNFRSGGTRRGARIEFSQTPQIHREQATFEIIVPARREWRLCVQVTPIIDGEDIVPRYRCGEPVAEATPMERLAKWRRDIPGITTDHEGLRRVVDRSAEDLGALRIFDPDYPERTVVAAGAPWFMTLFGRDSLLTSWMALLVDPDMALGVLQTLARFQGSDVDARNEEEPGRILHEMRFGEAASLSLGGGRVYYGTADATPLFVMLLGELRRWGLAAEVVDQLLPHADRAMEWIEGFGDRDGDGYVEYQRATDRGLENQGWKDSWDGVRSANGVVAKAPIALCEVQAYVYGAYLARAHFAAEVGDVVTAGRFRTKASELKRRFNQDFWLEDRGWFAMGLGADKVPLDALASNMGHCLWTGIVDQDKAEHVARQLVSPEMFSGWGIRTLATSMSGYNPISYHCGSVWPHDNAIIAAGLMRYGFVEEAQRVVLALLDAAGSQGARLPELFSGIDRSEFPGVVSYPTSCSPQAWAAASPLMFLRTLLRLDPWVPHGKVWVAPAIPREIGHLRVERIPLGGSRMSIEVDGEAVKVEGLPPELELISAPRDPLTAG